jgi:exonuclease III
LSKQTSKQGIGKTKQQGNENNWKSRHLSILTVNVNGLNAPTNRHRIANYVKRTRPNHMLFTRDLSHWTNKTKQKHWLGVKGWKKIFHVNEPHKQAGIAILISDKVDFRLKSVKRQ